MKKAVKAFLAGILCIGLSACGSSGSSAKDDDKKKGRKWSLKHSIWRDMYDADTTDAWGRQFKYHWSSKTGYLTIMSSGCDGKWGTDDDLEKTAYADTSNHTKGEDR